MKFLLVLFFFHLNGGIFALNRTDNKTVNPLFRTKGFNEFEILARELLTCDTTIPLYEYPTKIESDKVIFNKTLKPYVFHEHNLEHEFVYQTEEYIGFVLFFLDYLQFFKLLVLKIKCLFKFKLFQSIITMKMVIHTQHMLRMIYFQTNSFIYKNFIFIMGITIKEEVIISLIIRNSL